MPGSRPVREPVALPPRRTEIARGSGRRRPLRAVIVAASRGRSRRGLTRWLPPLLAPYLRAPLQPKLRLDEERRE
jgi:hypothetical protein